MRTTISDRDRAISDLKAEMLTRDESQVAQINQLTADVESLKKQ